jgi:hypothetical protein
MKIYEILSPDAADDAEVAGTTPEGGVILKTKDGSEVVINDPSKFYKDPRDGAVHMKQDDPNKPATPQTKTPPDRQQLQKLRPGDKIVMDKPQGRTF